MRLATVAFVIELILGVALGILAGLKAGRAADSLVLVFTLLVISIPVFVLGFIMRQVFAFNLGWVSPNVQNSENWNELILPGACLPRCHSRTWPG